jgi:hypothetical protein
MAIRLLHDTAISQRGKSGGKRQFGIPMRRWTGGGGGRNKMHLTGTTCEMHWIYLAHGTVKWWALAKMTEWFSKRAGFFVPRSR